MQCNFNLLAVILCYCWGVCIIKTFKLTVYIQLVGGREVEERQQLEFISAVEAPQVHCRGERLVVRAANSKDEGTRKEGRCQVFSWSWYCCACWQERSWISTTSRDSRFACNCLWQTACMVSVISRLSHLANPVFLLWLWHTCNNPPSTSIS